MLPVAQSTFDPHCNHHLHLASVVLHTTQSAPGIPPVCKVKGIQSKKKYKLVAQKVQSVVASCPDHFRIKCKILGNLLADMPILDPNPPPFHPTGQYTQEHKDKLDVEHPGLLTDAECTIMHDLMCKQNLAFA
ncbi:hypothetical protein DXG03_009557 [Asterophora parasitica]|uniref:Uncharacterized protein n=1 Tax=Asterophora parasitica TaxID=117018 RepID=A0A9P7K9X1_9AGAR|nr:hypothetical protein DXG03_009557 [Asterophora parasitica]